MNKFSDGRVTVEYFNSGAQYSITDIRKKTQITITPDNFGILIHLLEYNVGANYDITISQPFKSVRVYNTHENDGIILKHVDNVTLKEDSGLQLASSSIKSIIDIRMFVLGSHIRNTTLHTEETIELYGEDSTEEETQSEGHDVCGFN